MELKGKIINFIGDSITQGCCVKYYENRFVNKIRYLTGAVCNNYGIAGTRIAPQHHPSEIPLRDRDFNARLDEMDPNADIVIVFGGTNDFGHGDAPFGTDADETDDTFCGALKVFYTSLKKRYPKALILVLTPMHRCGENNLLGEGQKKVPSQPLIAYVEQIRKTAVQFGLPILDLYNESSLDPNDDSVRRRCMPDGLHPNDSGHEIITNKILEYLREYQG